MNKIKILFFIEKITENGSIGGAEKVLFNLVNNMDYNKFDITVQTLFYEDISELLNRNITYKYCFYRHDAIASVLSRMESYFGLIYDIHIKEDYDIEIAYLEFGSTKIMASSTARKAKKLAWVHCDLNIALNDKEAFAKKTEKQYEAFDKVICVSNQVKKSFDQIFKDRFETIVLHNVVNSHEINLKALEQLPNDITKTCFTMCLVARFSPPKNIYRLLNTCCQLHNEGIIFELWLVGDGELRSEIEHFILVNNMSEYVKLLGFKANPYPYMREADLLVCSSDYEGFSTFVTEGVILRRPILTTECSGMHEILDNYPCGTICCNDDQAFYEALKGKIVNAHDSEISCENSLFDMENLVKANEEFFMSLL